jgi:hypothetical protein
MCLLIITFIFGIRNPSFSLCKGDDVCLDDLKCSKGKSAKGLGAIYLLAACAMMTSQSLVAAELISLKNNFNSSRRSAINSNHSLNQAKENNSEIKDTLGVSNNDVTQILSHTENDESFYAKKARRKIDEANKPSDKLLDDIYGTPFSRGAERWEQKSPNKPITIRDLDSLNSKRSRPRSREFSNTIPEEPIYRSKQKELQNLFDKSENDIYSMPALKKRGKVEKARMQMEYNFSGSDSKDSDKSNPIAAQQHKKDSTTISTSYTNYSKKDLTISKNFIRDRLVKRNLRSEVNVVSKMKNSMLKKNSFKSHSEMPELAAPALNMNKRPEDVPHEVMDIIEDELGGLYLSNNQSKR